METYRSAAHDAYEKLKDIFKCKDPEDPKCYKVYWRLGHSFDTIIDYLAISPTEDRDFGQIAIDAYNRSTGSACWYDDFSWWGVASLKAIHLNLFPNSGGLKLILEQCWNVGYNNAPNVWTYNSNKPEFKHLEPRFPGGVWNADWTKPGPLHPCGNMPIQPADDLHLGGIQNTVTNGLYFILATRLDLDTHSELYRKAAKAEYDFLNKWFTVNDHGNSDHDLRKYVEGGALIRERVATFANLEEVPGYNPRAAWAGDQGIILGGLVDRMRVVTSGSPDYVFLLERAKEIAAGVKSVVTTYDKGILKAWVNSTPEPDPDPEDYATGPGVYWRYLLHAYQYNKELKEHFRATGQTDFVLKNAENTDRVPDSDDLVHLTNRLAVLVAAIVMSQG
ncbi:MAG: hypothetical protein WBX38_15945 [Candidatus Sulfotelmatobacter sp.]